MRVRHGTSMRDLIFGLDEPEEMYGYGGDDDLWGDGGDDLLFGGADNDKLVGGGGADLLDGGDGWDLASYEDGKSGVYVRLDTGAGYAGFAAGDILIGIENLRGSNYADILVGDDHANRIEGGAGDDWIFGLGEVDVLHGGSGNDQIWGGLEQDYIDGEAGFDFVRYDYATERVDVRLGHPRLLGQGGGWAGEASDDSFWRIEGVVGSNFNDHIEGNNPSPAESIDGNNVLYGLGGDDEILGLAADDTLIGGEGADRLYGGTGFDIARYDDSMAGVYVTLETGMGYSGTAFNDRLVGIEGLIGSRFGDTLIGDVENNLLDGGDGSDVLQGHDGADVIVGSNDNDLLEGGSGADWLDGGNGLDTASYESAVSSIAVDLGAGLGFGRGTLGEACDDILIGIENLVGSIHADSLTGDGADNVLRGGQGADTLAGGFGNDQFAYHPGDLWSERDVIRDFGTGAGDSDTLVFYGLAASDIALTDVAGGVRVSVLDPTFGGDILVLGMTASALSGHLLFA